MDKLSPLFARFAPTARVFYSGSLCITQDFVETDGVGHLHLLRSGQLSVSSSTTSSLSSDVLTINQPSVLFYPRPRSHRLQPDPGDSPNLVCATVDLGIEMRNPLVMALPDVLVMPLHEVTALAPTLDLLFAEVFSNRCGRQAALDRLVEYFLILLLRHVIDSKMLHAGILAALNDARLSRSITAMHERPEHAWSLETLAEEAGMSRALRRSLSRSSWNNAVGISHRLAYVRCTNLAQARQVPQSDRPIRGIPKPCRIKKGIREKTWDVSRRVVE